MAFTPDQELYKNQDYDLIEDSPDPKAWLEVGFATDAGRSGKLNQDYYGIVETVYTLGQEAEAATPIIVGIVADGISSSRNSDVAGQLTVETIRRVLIENPSIPIKPRLDAAIRRANREVFQVAQADAAYAGTGATLIAAAFAADQLYVAHLGDCRAYIVRNRRINLLTIDHRWGQEAVDAGEMSPEEAMAHPDRNLITRLIGTSAQVEIDHQIIDIEKGALDSNINQRWPLVDRMWMQPGDAVLLCSDGLSDVLSVQQIEAVINRHPAQVAAQRLIEMVNQAGGPDNVTVLLFKLPTAKTGSAAWRPSNDSTKAKSKAPKTLLRSLIILLLLAGLGSGAWLIFNQWRAGNLQFQLPSQLTSLLSPWLGDQSAPPASATVDANTVGQTITEIKPVNGTTLSAVQRFEWTSNTTLPENETYELLIWPANANRTSATGVAGLGKETFRLLNLNSLGLTAGDYRWGVRIVRLVDGSEVVYLGANSEFSFAP